MKDSKLKWIKVFSSNDGYDCSVTFMAAIPEGNLYRHVSTVGQRIGVSMVFVPNKKVEKKNKGR